MVGEPQGDACRQRVHGRLPRARQHRALRSLGGPSHGHGARASRQHGVDGDVLPRPVLHGVQLANHDRAYQDVAIKFFEHFANIASAMNGGGLWDEVDGFYYDRLRLADRRVVPIRARSMVGLVPLAASLAVPRAVWERLPDSGARAEWFVADRMREKTAAHTAIRAIGQVGPVDVGGHPAAPTPLRDHAERGGVPLRLTACARSLAIIATTRSSSSNRRADASSSSITSPPSRRRGSSVATPTGGGRSGSR